MKIKDSFKLYLVAVKSLKPTTVKNYLSDFDHFWQWMKKWGVRSEKREEKEKKSTSYGVSLIKQIQLETISEYKKQLLAEGLSKATAKRRLATLAAFCQFCLEQRWLTKNPFLEIKTLRESSQEFGNTEILTKFASFLRDEGVKKRTIYNYLSDVRQFLSWLESGKNEKN